MEHCASSDMDSEYKENYEVLGVLFAEPLGRNVEYKEGMESEEAFTQLIDSDVQRTYFLIIEGLVEPD